SGRSGITRLAPFRIVVHQRARLLLVDRQALPDGVFTVVVALDERLSGDVVRISYLGRIEDSVIAAAAGRMNTSAAHALDDVFLGHTDFNDKIHGNAGLLQGFGLRYGAWEAIKQVAILAVWLLEAIFDQADDDVIGYQLAGIHDLLGLQSQWRLFLDGSAQHVACCYLRNIELLRNVACLGAFSGPRWAEKYQSHAVLLKRTLIRVVTDLAGTHWFPSPDCTHFFQVSQRVDAGSRRAVDTGNGNGVAVFKRTQLFQ